MTFENAILTVSDLTLSRNNSSLFRSISFQVRRGESVALVGPSGAGKTSLLNCILGTVRPDGGSIRVAGTEVVGQRSSGLARIRAEHIGVVFQHGELLGELSPVENVALPALIAGRSRDHAVARATKLLGGFGVPDGRTNSDHLSGGERQRTALARALINEPALVLADEPTGSLDPLTRDQVANVLFDAPRAWGCGILVVTHDPQIAARADRAITFGTLTPRSVA